MAYQKLNLISKPVNSSWGIKRVRMLKNWLPKFQHKVLAPSSMTSFKEETKLTEPSSLGGNSLSAKEMLLSTFWSRSSSNLKSSSILVPPISSRWAETIIQLATCSVWWKASKGSSTSVNIQLSRQHLNRSSITLLYKAHKMKMQGKTHIEIVLRN